MYACKTDYGSGDTYRAPLISNRPPEQQVRHRLFIDSRDCVSSLTDFSFTAYLSDPFRETSIGVSRFERVQSVELKGLSFPKIADDYVIMDVQELNDERLLGSNAANRSFAIMYFESSNLAVGTTQAMKGYDFYQKDIAYNPIIPSLGKLTVRFLKRDGAVITTADTNGVDHCSFMLEITTLV